MQLPRLKEWRESRGLLQKELASEARLSEFTITRIESGDSIRPSTARKVADALNVSVADLMERPPVPLVEAPGEAGLAQPLIDVPLNQDGLISEVLRIVKPETAETLHEEAYKFGVGELLKRFDAEELRELREKLPKERTRIYQEGKRTAAEHGGMPSGDLLGDLLNLDFNIECAARALELKETQISQTTVE